MYFGCMFIGSVDSQNFRADWRKELSIIPAVVPPPKKNSLYDMYVYRTRNTESICLSAAKFTDCCKQLHAACALEKLIELEDGDQSSVSRSRRFISAPTWYNPGTVLEGVMKNKFKHPYQDINPGCSTYSRLDNSVSIVTDYGLGSWGSIPGKGKIRLFFTASSPALGPTQPPIQWVPGALSQGIKQQGREADHSTPPSAAVKNVGAITPHSHTS
jgi:hypothetical protein